MKPDTLNRAVMMLLLACLPLLAQPYMAGDSVFGTVTVPGVNFTTGPRPGDVFREYIFIPSYYMQSPSDQYGLKASACTLKGIDISEATRAEICVEYWGGHHGTSDKKVIVNQDKTKPIYIPQPRGTPNCPNCYFVQMNGNSSRPVPLSMLKQGTNDFYIDEGPQICKPSWNWPHYWVYAFTLRIYYKSTKAGVPSGRIVSPKTGARIGENPVVEAEATATGSTVKRVDLIGLYTDYDWEGNGLYRQWHYITEHKRKGIGTYSYHIGTDKSSPYKLTWNTEWLPDQHLPIRVMARIEAANGLVRMTKANSKIWFLRTNRSVRMSKAFDVPEFFCVRIRQRKSCKIKLEGPAANAKRARLVFSGWSCAHNKKNCAAGTETTGKINGWQFGKAFGSYHNYKYIEQLIPVNVVAKSNPATFQIQSNCAATNEHACEIHWPGPAILLEYDFADTSIDTTKTDPWDDDTTHPPDPAEVNVMEAKADPNKVPQGETTIVTFSAKVISSKGAAITSVTIGVAPLGDSIAPLPMTKGTGNLYTLKYKMLAATAPKAYVLNVLAKDENGVTGSAQITLTVTGVGIAGTWNSTPARPGMRVVGRLLQLQIPQGAPYSFDLLDVSGRSVETSKGIGRGGRTVDLSNKGAGVYLARMRFGGKKILKRVTLLD